ncbi:pore-forming ESAT-6 family protein [Lichenihabitans psoromatis]|uniref:pore-forming ESAT-6 family protein n=1 Tax=Lichenihabitans psoromatis TaxID=2528642 RepID=UPI001035F7EF|nr:pore-forming ESAT-6 family protein [Lichenihabitans psoromatis]
MRVSKGMMVVTLASCVIGAASAQAQSQADQMKVMYQAGRNQLGVLEFCQDKGFSDAETIAVQQKLLGMIPSTDKSSGDEAEATGRKGMIAAMGIKQDLEAAAKTQGSSVEKLCQAMSTAIKQAGAQLPK